MSPLDLAGQTFGRLVVLSRSENSHRGASMWLCRCECGTEKVSRGNDLGAGRTRSCGCMAHGGGQARKPAGQITYHSAHARVKRAKGSPSTHPCADCGGRARDWSLRHDASMTLHGMSKGYPMRYSGNLDDYEARCRPCHRAYDKS